MSRERSTGIYLGRFCLVKLNVAMYGIFHLHKHRYFNTYLEVVLSELIHLKQIERVSGHKHTDRTHKHTDRIHKHTDRTHKHTDRTPKHTDRTHTHTQTEHTNTQTDRIHRC